jgi:putative aminopeptidase FrvX
MNNETMQLFQALTEIPAASGFEQRIRAFVRGELAKAADDIITDRLGGIFGVRYGDKSGPKVMVAGHMDEVGFLITRITDNGMLQFQPLGGWWNQTMLAQRVTVCGDKGDIPGVIGSIPPHLLDEASRSKPMDVAKMYIDIGAENREEAESFGIRPGQPAVPVCPFTPLAGGRTIMAKAWDNRYGVGLAIELMKAVKDSPPPNVLYSGATVQEELGLRGAHTAAGLIHPDVCYVLDASPANDTSGDKSAFGWIGRGALLRIYDKSMITHRGMVEFVRDTAESHSIPYQYFISPGGTDAGAIHLHGIGVPTAVIGICARYIHTAASIIHVDDYEAAKELLITLVRRTDRSTLNTLIDYH